MSRFDQASFGNADSQQRVIDMAKSARHMADELTMTGLYYPGSPYPTQEQMRGEACRVCMQRFQPGDMSYEWVCEPCYEKQERGELATLPDVKPWLEWLRAHGHEPFNTTGQTCQECGTPLATIEVKQGRLYCRECVEG